MTPLGRSVGRPAGPRAAFAVLLDRQAGRPPIGQQGGHDVSSYRLLNSIDQWIEPFVASVRPPVHVWRPRSVVRFCTDEYRHQRIPDWSARDTLIGTGDVIVSHDGPMSVVVTV